MFFLIPAFSLENSPRKSPRNNPNVFFEQVKRTFANEPETYDKFVEIMKLFKTQVRDKDNCSFALTDFFF
jgi:histone deacetylase complex regulatory component SIN3